jgi:hypothetical protein
MKNISRRHAIGLGGAALAAAGLPRLARATPAYGVGGVNNIGREIIPFTIVNNSGSSQPAYLYMFGTTNPLKAELHTVYLSDLNGDCTLFPPNTNGKTYGLPLTGRTTNALFPQLDGLRIYISFGKQLVVDIPDNGIPIAISADVPGDNPNYSTLWDFVEATWHNYDTFTVLDTNVTQVDAFGLAFEVGASGFNPADPQLPLSIINGFASNAARGNIFNRLAKAGAPWSNLVISNARAPLRALMPLKSLDLGVFPKNQLATYINQVVKYYDFGNTSNRLIFPYGGVDYTGYTKEGAFVFTPGKTTGDNGVDTTIYKIMAPTTRECYAQNITPMPDDGPGGAIAAALGASFLRSTLVYYPDAGFPVPQADRSLYYTKPPICEYAKIIHAYGINNHAFCYGYDEVAGDAGVNRQVWNPKSYTLTIRGL